MRLLPALLALCLAACTPTTAPSPSSVSATSTSTATSPSVSGAPQPAGTIPPMSQVTLESTCPAKAKGYTVADTTNKITQKYLFAMRTLGVSTIFKYYDWAKETIPGKTLTKPEMDLVHLNGMSVAVVFQHNNSALSTFTSSRGTIDANRSLELAKGLGQPKGSAVYAGVDNDFATSSGQAAVKAYFSAFSPLIRKAGFRVGAYGSGQACTNLLAAKLIDLCWISQSKGFTGTAAYVEKGGWALHQAMPADMLCGGNKSDFNTAGVKDFGQW